MTSRLLRREALRRTAEELNTMTSSGLEQALARISTEVTEEAAYRREKARGADRARTQPLSQSLRDRYNRGWYVKSSLSFKRSRLAREHG
jgi:hypothetical protein